MENLISNKLKNLKPSAIREIFKSLSDPSIIAFAAGNPSPESFPMKELGEISEKIYKEAPVAALQYSITEGYGPLRESVAARLKEKFDIGSDNDMTIITTGGQQAIDLFAKVMINEGDVVLCENPSFIGALNCFRANGAVPVGVELTSDGIDTEKLEKALIENKNVKFIYVIPTFQNPAGITTSLEKRRAVYELAKKYKVMILEDNPYGELRFAGENIPTIKSFDTDGIVMYCGSFSKILSAGMRVGFACGPAKIMQKMVVAKQVNDVHTNIYSQMLCEGFIKDYDLDAHIAKTRELYKHKCTLMLESLDKYMPDCVSYTRPEGGLFLWCTLPEYINLEDFVQTALKNKVAVVPGTAFNCDVLAPSDSFRLNYSTPTDEQIVSGVKILADIIKSYEGK